MTGQRAMTPRAMAVAILLPFAAPLGGCGRNARSVAQGHVSPAATPAIALTTRPSALSNAIIASAGPQTYENKPAGIRLNFPGDWTPRPSQDYVLLIAPANERTPDSTISLDIPDLPPHLPWMIGIGAVENGYFGDLKKIYPNVKLVESTRLTSIPNAAAKRICTAWDSNGTSRTEAALLIVHNSRVYILRADAPTSQMPRVRKTFDAIASSLQWIP